MWPRLADVVRVPGTPETVEAMRAFDLSVMAVGHCTGWRAVRALENAFETDRALPYLQNHFGNDVSGRPHR